jgi:hypothetical protein
MLIEPRSKLVLFVQAIERSLAEAGLPEEQSNVHRLKFSLQRLVDENRERFGEGIKGASSTKLESEPVDRAVIVDHSAYPIPALWPA